MLRFPRHRALARPPSRFARLYEHVVRPQKASRENDILEAENDIHTLQKYFCSTVGPGEHGVEESTKTTAGVAWVDGPPSPANSNTRLGETDLVFSHVGDDEADVFTMASLPRSSGAQNRDGCLRSWAQVW